MADSEENTEIEEFTHVFINSPIDSRLFREVMSKVPSFQPRHKCGVLTLITYGGSANDAYRIGRLLQMMFPEFYVHVPTVCASAGTLLVCAAQRLIISPLSELGPLDAQIIKADELHDRRSGLVVRSLFDNLGHHAFELQSGLVERIIAHSGGNIKYRTAAHVAGEMVVGLMRGLYDQINPEQIGEDYRILRIAEEYGKRLARRGGNVSEEALKELVYEFPSHDFIIDFSEAVRLFEAVDVASEALTDELKADTPLNPVEGTDRVVRIANVVGRPTFVEAKDEEPGDEHHGDEDSSHDEDAREGAEPPANPSPADGANARRGRGRE